MIIEAGPLGADIEAEPSNGKELMAALIRFGITILAMTSVVLLEPAGMNIKSGTTVIVGISPKRIVIAADSRLTDRQTEKHDDNACKIMALRGQLIFAMTGTSQAYALDSSGRVLWDGHDVLRTTADAFPSDSSLIDGLPDKWAASMLPIFASVAPFAKWTPGFIATGVFGGVGKTGQLVLKQVAFNYDPSSLENLTASVQTLSGISTPGSEGEMNYGAFGLSNIVQEFLTQMSFRAKDEADSWRFEMSASSEQEREWRKAARLADLAVAYEPGGEVGGNIDVVELTAAGPRWLQRKPQCPD